MLWRRDGKGNQKDSSKSCGKEDRLTITMWVNIHGKVSWMRKRNSYLNTSNLPCTPWCLIAPTSRKRSWPWRFFVEELSLKSLVNHRKIELLVSPKYQRELTGEWVEYAWGMMKCYHTFRAFPWTRKHTTKEKFEKVVTRETVGCVSKINMEMFSARCQRYMMAYIYI